MHIFNSTEMQSFPNKTTTNKNKGIFSALFWFLQVSGTHPHISLMFHNNKIFSVNAKVLGS